MLSLPYIPPKTVVFPNDDFSLTTGGTIFGREHDANQEN